MSCIRNRKASEDRTDVRRATRSEISRPGGDASQKRVERVEIKIDPPAAVEKVLAFLRPVELGPHRATDRCPGCLGTSLELFEPIHSAFDFSYRLEFAKKATGLLDRVDGKKKHACQECRNGRMI